MSLNEKHISAFERLKPVKKFSFNYNSLKPDKGIIVEFENVDSRHRVLLDRVTANRLAKALEDAEFNWRFSTEMNSANMSEEES